MKSPEETRVIDVLSRYTGKLVYLHEVSGNNGDELIFHGSERLIEQCGCVRVPSPQSADVLLVNGGFKSDFWPFANQVLRSFSLQFPKKPLVILPSSFLYETTDFAELFNGRSSPVIAFAREIPSLKILQDMNFGCEVEFGLDHDSAFALADDPKFQILRAQETTRDILIVERGDIERVSSKSENSMFDLPLLKSIALRVIPSSVMPIAARFVGQVNRVGAGEANTLFAKAAVDLAREHLNREPERMLVADISRRSYCTFDQFCKEIASSEVVVSTRLHVAILAAILGRKTYIVSGKYHKIPGIYQFSMLGMDHVKIVNSHCELIQ